MTPLYQIGNEEFTLYHGDAMELIGSINKKVDMIFADPPYFLSKNIATYINGTWKSFEKGEWDRVTSHENINAFNREWLSACRNVLKEDGTIFVTGTYHNIFSVATCMVELGYKILNIIVWQKSDAKPTLSRNYFNFTTEYIVWARKNEKGKHFFNCDLMEQLNGGNRMSDVWRIPFLSSWELKCGKHPTQKPLRLLYRIILSSTREGDLILDPFAGSCTTGIAANLLGRKFIGIDQSVEFLDYGIRRKQEILDPLISEKFLRKISENPEEAHNHQCRWHDLPSRLGAHLWTKETLENYGFEPSHAPYYIVLRFDNSKPIPYKQLPNLKESGNTYIAKIKPLSDFMGIK